ncbi:MAG: hypothetical protein KF874_12640 [Rhizobiaceae bacterium]|nr:hypothetical protein [Rhizobiaceae bacterium]
MTRRSINRRVFIKGVVAFGAAGTCVVGPANARRRRSRNDFGSESDRTYYRPTGFGIWHPRRRQGWGLPALLTVAAIGLAFVLAAMRFCWLRRIVVGAFGSEREWRKRSHTVRSRRLIPRKR